MKISVASKEFNVSLLLIHKIAWTVVEQSAYMFILYILYIYSVIVHTLSFSLSHSFSSIATLFFFFFSLVSLINEV